MTLHFGILARLEVEFIAAIFVDDEAFFFKGSTLAVVDRAIDILLNTLEQVFLAFYLRINWKAGKTEVMLLYRGNTWA